MEKYGVEQASAEKQGQHGGTEKCPKCGDEVEVHCGVKLCGKHGSEPYEDPQPHAYKPS